MRVLVLNGPNMNVLGLRERALYGAQSYADLERYIQDEAARLDMTVEIRQSNHEGDLVDWIQQAYGQFDGLVLNPAAYTHTSIAILDALKAVRLPAVEVHLTDIDSREAFRRVSYAGMACQAHYNGLGFAGYGKALAYLKENV